LFLHNLNFRRGVYRLESKVARKVPGEAMSKHLSAKQKYHQGGRELVHTFNLKGELPFLPQGVQKLIYQILCEEELHLKARV